ncbi:T9SS type A sorting domain-containing protein, partial [Algoriphagus aquimarinus]
SDWAAFAINQIAASITVIRSSGDYNGNPFEATGAVTGLGGTPLSPSVTFEYEEYNGSVWSSIAGAPTDAGSYRVRSNFAGNTNYISGSSDWAAFAINQIAASITVTGYTGTYDGAAHGATVTAIGIQGETLVGLNLGASFTNVPGGTAYWTFIDITGNYTDDNGSVQIVINEASTTISVQNSIADCDGDDVTLTAIVNTINPAIQADVNSLGGIVTFKNGSTTIGTVTASSVTGGTFSNSFPISLPLGTTYSITAEFVPYSGNLTGSQSTTVAQLTVMKATISSSIPKNSNGNVVIFDGAASSLGLPSSTTLTAAYQPSSYSGVTYKWFSRNDGGTFTHIPNVVNSTYQVVANGDFVREYKVELIVNGQCVGNEIFSKVISVEASCGKAGQDKVQVCHVMPNGKRNNICVSANAVNALLAGSPGSYIGNCNVTYRMEDEPELITVPWNTPLEVINDKIVSQSENWFEQKKIKLTINAESYNPLAAGFYEMKVDVQANEWFTLEEQINVNVLVADKPLATDIKLSNSILLRNIHNGSVIGDFNTIDPVDDQHTYTIAEHTDFELVGKSVVWKGTVIPATARITVFSTDRAGQTIERAIELSREPRFGEFNMFPNPASSDVNLEVELDQSMNVGIRIYDAVGRLVYQEEGVQNGMATYQIAIAHLSPGIYTVQVKTGILVMNKRLIKK